MKKCLGIVFLENLISVKQENVFGTKFAAISDWSAFGGGG